jgi:hypothetical protein
MKALGLITLLSAPAFAQIQVNIPLPQIQVEVAPPMVEVHPGVQVVQNSEDEVFSSGGWYWARRDGTWFRSRDLTHPAWAIVRVRDVPPVLVGIQPGRYRRWSPPPPAGAQVQVMPAPPPPQPMPPPPRTGAGVVRAKEIKAGRLTVRVIFCKELKAKSGRVMQHDRREGNDDWVGNEIKVPELSADTIYAKEIKADWIDVGEAHCKEVKIGGD